MNAKVLVVEDEVLIRWSLVEALKAEEGLTVFEAENGPSALKILGEQPEIAFVVTDIQMSGSPGGVGLYQEIKRTHPQTHVLLVSGRGRPAALAADVPYLDKPYAIEIIVDSIRRGGFANPG